MEERRQLEQDDRRKSRYRDIVTGVFGLVLALGAFSITTTDFNTPGQVWGALRIFTPAFFFVLVIWQITGDLFDRYPSDDHLFYTLVMLELFLVTLAPAFLNLMLDDQRSVVRLSAALFPLSMAGVFAILALLWWRLARLMRRRGQTPEREVRDSAIAEVVLAAIFLVSLLLPFDHDRGTPRAYVWFGAFVAPDVMLWLARRAGR